MAVPATASPALGSPAQRIEAHEKVTGAARYAYEHPREDAAYGWIIGATVARGTIRSIDAAPALSAPGVIAVLTHENAPELQAVPDGELSILQSPEVSYRGQIVGAVVAETLEAAREAASLVRIDYNDDSHDVVLTPEHPKLYKPDVVNPRFPTDTEQGDFDAAFARAAVQLDATYITAATHNNPMEPHATMAVWDGGGLTLYDSTQGAPSARDGVAKVLGLEPEQVRVISPHVGGGFGSKGTPRPHVVLAALCAKVTGRPVKLAVTRQQMFDLTGYRTPTIQRIRLGADADGRLSAIAHEVVEQTSTVKEFAEQTATPTRLMYTAEHRRTSHRLAPLDVPTPSWMRAPGEAPGMFALESAIDELAVACGIDPDRAADPQRAGPRSGARNAVQLPQPRRVPTRGCRALRLGHPRSDARRPPGRALARRQRRRRGDLPGLPAAEPCARPGAPGWPLRGRCRRSGHRHRGADRPDPDRR